MTHFDAPDAYLWDDDDYDPDEEYIQSCKSHKYNDEPEILCPKCNTWDVV